MKHFKIILIIAVVTISCKNESSKKEVVQEKQMELTVAEKIANAHGYENWKNVERIDFTFKVDREGKEGDGRSWSWFPKKDSVIMKAGEQEVFYNRIRLDSVPANADKAFINDKFWLLVPFQLVWDEGTTMSEPALKKAPISGNELKMITLTYGNTGGYTPGDAYDIYFDGDFVIREWIFRQGNQDEPSMMTTFENYRDFNGIKIAQDHRMPDSDFNLRFTEVKVELQADKPYK